MSAIDIEKFTKDKAASLIENHVHDTAFTVSQQSYCSTNIFWVSGNNKIINISPNFINSFAYLNRKNNIFICHEHYFNMLIYSNYKRPEVEEFAKESFFDINYSELGTEVLTNLIFVYNIQRNKIFDTLTFAQPYHLN